MFSGPTTIDICAAVRPPAAVAAWLDTTVTAVSGLAGFAWLIILAARHPAPVISRRREITCYSVGAAGFLPALLLHSPLFELVRVLMAIALVVRLAGVRGQQLAPGERWLGWRDGWFPRGWGFSACAMTVGLAVSAWASMVVPDWVGVAPTDATNPADIGTFRDWLVVALSGPVEELVAMAGVVAALEWARRPAWLIFTVTICIRVAYHVHLGIPTAFSATAFAAASTWAFRRWRMVSPLAAMHTAYNTVLTIFYL